MNALLEKAFAAVAKLPEQQQEAIASRILAEVEPPVQADQGPEDASLPLLERIKRVQAAFATLKQPGGQPADKAFYDELSGDL